MTFRSHSDYYGDRVSEQSVTLHLTNLLGWACHLPPPDILISDLNLCVPSREGLGR